MEVESQFPRGTPWSSHGDMAAKAVSDVAQNDRQSAASGPTLTPGRQNRDEKAASRACVFCRSSEE